jgi:hypothetical protein
LAAAPLARSISVGVAAGPSARPREPRLANGGLARHEPEWVSCPLPSCAPCRRAAGPSTDTRGDTRAGARFGAVCRPRASRRAVLHPPPSPVHATRSRWLLARRDLADSPLRAAAWPVALLRDTCARAPGPRALRRHCPPRPLTRSECRHEHHQWAGGGDQA